MAEIVALATPHTGWGTPLGFDPVPWESHGSDLGFENAITVRSDDDWRAPIPSPDIDAVLRYVLIPIAGQWELRAGNTKLAAVAAGTGGLHSHMFSVREATAAEAAGKQILSGWIYAIADDHLVID